MRWFPWCTSYYTEEGVKRLVAKLHSEGEKTKVYWKDFPGEGRYGRIYVRVGF